MTASPTRTASGRFTTRAAQNRADAAAIVAMVAERDAAIQARAAAAAPVAYWPAEIDATDYDAGWHRAAAARRAQRHRADRRAAAAAAAAQAAR